MLLAERTCPAVCDGVSGHIGIGLHSAGLVKGFSRRLCNFKIVRMRMICFRVICFAGFISRTMLLTLKASASNTANTINIVALLVVYKKIQSERCH